MVKDLRQSKSPRTTKSLRDLCSEEGGCVNSSLGERKGGGTGSAERRGRSLGRPKVRELGEPADSKLINVGSHPAFRPTKGLCLLFNAGGGAEEFGGERGELKRFDLGSEGSYESQPKTPVCWT